MTDGTGTSTYTYDPFGEQASITNGANQQVGYGYDALGDVVSIAYPLATLPPGAVRGQVDYAYDAASRMLAMSDFADRTSSFAHTPDGLVSQEGLGTSADSVTTSYDPLDQVASSVLTSGSTTLDSLTYSDAPSGSIATETDSPTSSTSSTYAYDSQIRTTSDTIGTNSAKTYAFDASGNPTVLPSSATGTFDGDSELTKSVASGVTTTYTYSTDGERVSAAQGSTTLASATYDGALRLLSYSDPAANTSTVAYNGDGLRTSATTTPTGGQASTQAFVWDTLGSVPEVLMDSTNAYLYGPTGPVEQVSVSTGATDYLFADAIGSVRAVAGSSGSLLGSVGYDAWGNPDITGGLSSLTPIGYAGAYTDPTRLVYLIGRYYDPATGQFLSIDPDVAVTGQPYVYVGDNPVNGVDPLGLSWWNPTTWTPKTWKKVLIGTGVALGAVAALTGVGAVLDAGVAVGLESTSLGYTAIATGTVATGIDAVGCLSKSSSSDERTSSCSSAVVGLLSGGLGAAALVGGPLAAYAVASAAGLTGAAALLDALQLAGLLHPLAPSSPAGSGVPQLVPTNALRCL